jgi:hypothetical protein
MNRKQIIQKFLPFHIPESIDSILMGNDLDAILSAQFLHDRFGWEIVGLYDLENIWHDEAVDIRQKIRDKKIVAIDLDIYHRTIPSLGHHILQLRSTDQLSGFSNSMNPNLLRKRSKQNFRWKYPLGTIHFLRWLFNDKKRSDDYELLCWLADSTFINAQRYRENVNEWLKNFLDCDYFFEYFERTASLEFEQRIQQRILQVLAQINLDNITSMTESQHLKIKGYQTRIRNVNKDYPEIMKLLNYISDISELNIPKWPQKFVKIPGLRTNVDLNEALKNHKRFDDFLVKENIFSYALTYKNTLNYTKFEKK